MESVTAIANKVLAQKLTQLQQELRICSPGASFEMPSPQNLDVVQAFYAEWAGGTTQSLLDTATIAPLCELLGKRNLLSKSIALDKARIVGVHIAKVVVEAYSLSTMQLVVSTQVLRRVKKLKEALNSLRGNLQFLAKPLHLLQPDEHLPGFDGPVANLQEEGPHEIETFSKESYVNGLRSMGSFFDQMLGAIVAWIENEVAGAAEDTRKL